MKISVMFGARSEAIKLCPIILALRSDSFFECKACVTGQHREMLQQVLDVFGEGFEHVCTVIRNLSERFPDVHFVYPVHLNPNVREPVERILGRKRRKNVHLISPQGYLPLVALMERSCLILTDSGGVQEEAPSLGKPVLVMRDTTERPEAVEAGTVKIVGTSCTAVESETSALLMDDVRYGQMAKSVNPYGDGRAVVRIVNVLKGI